MDRPEDIEANPVNGKVSKGNLWIATDGQGAGLDGIHDSVCAVPTDGPERGCNRRLLSAVTGSETASLVFNSDDSALFVSVQHPGEGGKWTDNAADAISRFPGNSVPPKSQLWPW